MGAYASLAARLSADHLVHAENVSFRIAKPCGLLRAQDTDLIHRLQTREIVIVKYYASKSELTHSFGHIAYFEAQRSVLRFRTLGFREQGECSATDREQMFAISTLACIRKAEYVCVVRSSARGRRLRAEWLSLEKSLT